MQKLIGLLLVCMALMPAPALARCNPPSLYIEAKGAIYFLSLTQRDIFLNPEKGLTADKKLSVTPAEFHVIKAGAGDKPLGFDALTTLLEGDNCLSDDMFGTDKKTVFFHERPVEGADAASFKALDSGFAKDASAVYFEDKKIPEADPETFEMAAPASDRVPGIFKKPEDKKKQAGWMAGNLARDQDHYFCGPHIFLKSAAVLLGKGYIRDNEKICTNGKLVEGVGDVASFEFSEAGFSRDKNAVYILQPADPFTLYMAARLEGADPATITYMEDVKTPGDCPFMKDKEHVYPMLGDAARHVLKNVDAASFHCTECPPHEGDVTAYCGEDKNGLIVYGGGDDKLDVEVIERNSQNP